MSVRRECFGKEIFTSEFLASSNRQVYEPPYILSTSVLINKNEASIKSLRLIQQNQICVKMFSLSLTSCEVNIIPNITFYPSGQWHTGPAFEERYSLVFLFFFKPPFKFLSPWHHPMDNRILADLGLKGLQLVHFAHRI